MDDAALRRTIRRCVAVVVIPLSLYPLMFVGWLDDDGVPYSHPALELGYDVALWVLVGAILYLVGSFGFQTLYVVANDGEDDARG